LVTELPRGSLHEDEEGVGAELAAQRPIQKCGGLNLYALTGLKMFKVG